jgi:exonuclease III
MSIRVLTWNLEWSPPCFSRHQEQYRIICELAPDVTCLTEVRNDGQSIEGNLIQSESDYGFQHNGNRRKVVLWSTEPWESVDNTGHSDMPTGRFVSALSHGIRFVGVCIPWKDAHVRNERKDFNTWEDHLNYLEGLRDVLARYSTAPEPLCLIGDFNQRVPRQRQPRRVFDMLNTCLAHTPNVLTSGDQNLFGQLIDLIALSSGMSGEIFTLIEKHPEGGIRLSEHHGITAMVH